MSEKRFLHILTGSITFGTEPPYPPVDGTKIEVAVQATPASDIIRGFATVIHGQGGTNPSHPWDPLVTSFVEATPDSNGLMLFTLANGNPVPGARGDCQNDTLVVWGIFSGDPCFLAEPQQIKVGIDCDGSSSSNTDDREVVWKADVVLPYELTGTFTDRKGTDQELPDRVTFRKQPDLLIWVWKDPKANRTFSLFPMEKRLVLSAVDPDGGSVFGPGSKGLSVSPLHLEFLVSSSDPKAAEGFSLTVTE